MLSKINHSLDKFLSLTVENINALTSRELNIAIRELNEFHEKMAVIWHRFKIISFNRNSEVILRLINRHASGELLKEPYVVDAPVNPSAFFLPIEPSQSNPEKIEIKGYSQLQELAQCYLRFYVNKSKLKDKSDLLKELFVERVEFEDSPCSVM